MDQVTSAIVHSVTILESMVQEENKIHELKLITTMSSEMILLTITIMVSVPHSPFKRDPIYHPPSPMFPN